MRMINFLFVGVAVLCATAASAARYSWAPALTSGEAGGDAPWGRVHFDPNNSNVMWAATTQVPDPFATEPLPDGNGLWKSTDGGRSWSQMASGALDPTLNILDFSISKSNSDVVYVATLEGGVLKTINGGSTWTAINQGLGLPHAKNGAGAVVVDPTNSDNVYVSVGQLNGIQILSPSPDHPGFFYSHDGGATWIANNSGLPNRSDAFLDLVSNTSVPVSLVIPDDQPETIYAGILTAEANGKVFLGKKAIADTQVFRNTTSGTGTWSPISDGLKSVVTNDSGIGSLLRFSVTGVILSSVTVSGRHVLYMSNLAAGGEVDLGGEDATKLKSQGIWLLAPGSTTWLERNTGLPVVNDAENDNAINSCPVGTVPGDPYTALTGVLDSDGTLAGSTKIWATATAGDPWMMNWGDSGLDNSPTLGLPYCNAIFIEVAPNGRRAIASVAWDGEGSSLNDDDGVYMVPPPSQ